MKMHLRINNDCLELDYQPIAKILVDPRDVKGILLGDDKELLSEAYDEGYEAAGFDRQDAEEDGKNARDNEYDTAFDKAIKAGVITQEQFDKLVEYLP